MTFRTSRPARLYACRAASEAEAYTLCDFCGKIEIVCKRDQLKVVISISFLIIKITYIVSPSQRFLNSYRICITDYFKFKKDINNMQNNPNNYANIFV